MKTMEYLVSKTELELVENKVNKCLTENEFSNFMVEYKDFQSKQIQSDEFEQIFQNIETLKKNADTFVTKEMFFSRFTVLFNEMTEQFRQRPTIDEFKLLKKQQDDKIEKN